MILKDPWEVSGLHTTWTVWCSRAGCNRFEIVWISQDYECPNRLDIHPSIDERGWIEFDGHWLCSDCVVLYQRMRVVPPLELQPIPTVAPDTEGSQTGDSEK